MGFDLHAHTNASDGSYTPKELVKLASSNGLKGVAVTDHDTCDGVLIAKQTGETMGIQVVPGVELGTVWQSREVHLLGYFLHPEHPDVTQLFQRMRQERVYRMEKMVTQLQQAGVQITIDEVYAFADGAVIGRPHIGRILVQKGYSADLPDAFQNYLTPGKPGYVKRPKLSPQEAIEVVKRSGGVPVLAHPGLIGNDEIIPELVASGLRGIEVLHPDHSDEQRIRYRKVAEQYGLIPTGGSDFHGQGAEHRGDLGSVQVPDEIVDKLYETALQIQAEWV